MVSITSFNANGLRNMLKLEQVLITCCSDILCLQETCWTDAIMDNVRTKWGDHIFVNNGSERSCGVAILIKQGVVDNVKQIMTDAKGRVLVVEFEYQNTLYKLINVYAPNVELERRDLFTRLKPLSTGNCILVGDFNLKCCRLDAVSSATYKFDTSRNVLLKMMDDNSLVDKWREENPNTRAFSRRQVVMGELKQSRIDLCIVKRDIANHIKQIGYKFTGFSDHAMLSFKVSLRDESERGGGLWCLNSSLLSEEGYRNVIKNCIQCEVESLLMHNNVSEWWEILKKKIKILSIRYAKRRNSRKKQEENKLREALSREIEKAGSNTNYKIENYLKIKAELDKYEQNKCMGAIVRSRAQYAVEGERCTSFFLGLEKTKKRKAYIHELENTNGEKVSDLVSILETVQSFYRDLFKKSDVDNESVESILNKVTVEISQSEKQLCDDDILIDEVKGAINSLQPNKSPGSDGLTGEFYKVFADVLAPILLRVYKQMEEEQLVSKSMSTGVLTILYKNRGSNMKLENYRPISLLNNDYKIIAKVLANRIKSVLGSIISPTQAYSVPGRDIADIICTMRDVIHYMNNDGEGGFVLNVDLNKAFDRVEHNFLFKTMERYGFGPRLIRWLRLLYSNARSCVKCNGVLTDTFPLERSVRQGCPLSAILYSISVEPLATLVKGDRGIKCVKIPGGGECVIQQYADDTSFTVRDMGSIKRIVDHLHVYGKASGAKINIDKSELMCVGNVGAQGCDIPFKVAKDYIKILGVNIGVKEKEARDITWTGVLNKMKQTLNFWKQRGLRLKGKVIVINALILSKVVYVMGALDIPEWVLKEINRVVSDFLWRGKGVRISHQTLMAGYKKGGLKLVDIETKKKAIRIKTVIKYVCDKTEYGWKHFFREYIQKAGKCEDYGLLMALKQPMHEGMPLFYREVLSAWAKLLPHIDYECKDINMIINNPIFLNGKLKNDNDTLYNAVFIRAGIRQIKDIMYEVKPGLLPEHSIVDMVREIDCDVRKATIIGAYNKIKSCMSIEWMDRINSNEEKKTVGDWPELYIERGNHKVSLDKLKVKTVYQIVIENVLKRPASDVMWKNKYNDIDVDDIWRSMVKHNSLECDENDFKIKHNRIYTKIILHQINRNLNRMCDVCKQGDEDLFHLFLNCGCLSNFFKRLKCTLYKHWEGAFIEGINWEHLLLFGTVVRNRRVNTNLLNFVLSHARLAVRLRRNYAHFEGKIVDVWNIFESILKRDLDLILKYNEKIFVGSFVEGNTMVEIREGKLIINF